MYAGKQPDRCSTLFMRHTVLTGWLDKSSSCLTVRGILCWPAVTWSSCSLVYQPAPFRSLPTMWRFFCRLCAWCVISMYGSILKINSTKVTKKLAGADVGSASLATNVGNKRGEIVQRVITALEGMKSLKQTADGLMDWYEAADQPHPQILYTDQDCCTVDGSGRYKLLFNCWPSLSVHFDIWHFIRRLAFRVTTKSHAHYGTFLSRLSSCIFEWDEGDVEALPLTMQKLCYTHVYTMCIGTEQEKVPSVEDTIRPFFVAEDKLWHCRGRLQNANLPWSTIHPLLLDEEHHLTTLIIWQAHKKFMQVY